MASTTAQVSLTSATTGTGTVVDFTTAKKTVTAVVATTGGVNAGHVLIEASQDNVIFVPLAQVDVMVSKAQGVSLNGQAYRYWRARVVRDLIGSTPKVGVTFMEAD